MIPAGVELFSFNAAFFGGLFLEHIQGEAAKGGEVFGGVTCASTALVFIKADVHVHDSVQFIFHSPVAAHGSSEELYVQWWAR